MADTDMAERIAKLEALNVQLLAALQEIVNVADVNGFWMVEEIANRAIKEALHD